MHRGSTQRELHVRCVQSGDGLSPNYLAEEQSDIPQANTPVHPSIHPPPPPKKKKTVEGGSRREEATKGLFPEGGRGKQRAVPSPNGQWCECMVGYIIRLGIVIHLICHGQYGSWKQPLPFMGALWIHTVT